MIFIRMKAIITNTLQPRQIKRIAKIIMISNLPTINRQDELCKERFDKEMGRI